MALYLNEADVAQLIDMPTALAALDAVHRAHAQGLAIDVERQRVRTPSAMQHVLQAAWPERGVMGYKAYTSSAVGVRFWVHLFDASTGAALAVIEANLLGMMRTGAASGVATRQLARDNASVAAIIGSGWQAQGQLLAMARVRGLEEVRVYSRHLDRASKFCSLMAEQTGKNVRLAPSAQAAVEGCDIVTTITTSARPVLEGEWLAPGMHINAAGSNALIRRELDAAAVARADVLCVDGRATAEREAGDLLPLLEKGRLNMGATVELGELLAGQRQGRQTAQQITLFESQGMGIQDIALAAEILDRARTLGIGQALPY